MPQAKANLAYVVNSLNPGGTEKLVIDMSLQFERDYTVSVVCLDVPGEWADQLRARGIPVVCLWRQPGLDLSMPVLLAKFFKESSIDIVHAHQCTAWFYSALARIRYSKPKLLFQEHGRFFPEVNNPIRRLINRVIISRLTSRAVAVSEDIRERLVVYEGLRHSAIEVVYNGVRLGPTVDTDGTKSLRRELGLHIDDFVVGTIGRLDSIKNIPMFLKSVVIAKRDSPNLRAIVVGDGPEKSALELLARSYGLSDCVQFLGHRSDIGPLLSCFDLFVLSSLSEGISLALLEAVAQKTPVAVTAVGGNPEVVVGNATGWLVPFEAEDALARAIVEARCHPAKGERYAAAAYERFLELFRFDTMIDNYQLIYAEMLKSRKCFAETEG